MSKYISGNENKMKIQVTGPVTTGQVDVNALRASWDLSVASLVLQVTLLQ